MYGYRDPFNRQCFPWDNIDDELYNFFVKIGNVRKKLNFLLDAKIKIIKANENVFEFERYIEENEIVEIRNNRKHVNKIVVIVNRSENDVPVDELMKYESEKILFEYNLCDGFLSKYGIVIKAVK